MSEESELRTRPELSIVVVTHNGRDLALATLRSALQAAAGIEVEWMVVDSGSVDDTPEAIEAAFPEISVIRAENRGFAAANNVAIRRAKGRYVLLMNPDVEIDTGAFADLVATMDERPEVGIASVLHRGAAGELQYSIRRFPSVLRDLGEALFAARWPVMSTLQELETRPHVYAEERSVDWLVGAFLIARATAISQVGLMDERFFLYSEEIDWCYRFGTAGWDVRHLPVMTIIHHAGRRDRGDLMAQLAYSRQLFAHKHFGALKALGIRAALVLGHMLRLTTHAPHAALDAASRSRLRAERHALAVQLGIAHPPYAATPAIGGGAHRMAPSHRENRGARDVA